MNLTISRLRHIMIKQISTVFLAAGIAGSTLTAQATNPHWIEYGNEPVLIEQNNNGAKQTLKFVNFTDGMLVAKLDGGIGEISLPVSESMVQSLHLDNAYMSEVNHLISRGNYTGALIKLRPKAYPLIKFHQVPESFVQLHVPIRSLIETLIQADELDEAYDVINHIQLDKVGLKYCEGAVALLNAYLAKDNFDQAIKMTQQIPLHGKYAVNIRPVINAADALRAAGKYDAVIPLYRQIEKVVDEDAKKNVRLWLAYSLVLADRIDEATPMIQALEEPAPADRLFSLYKLLQGSLEHKKQNYGQALDLLTRGFVRAQTSYVQIGRAHV